MGSYRQNFNQYLISLDEYAGNEITIELITSPGPSDDNKCDWGVWLTPYLGDMNPGGWERLPVERGRVWKNTRDTRMAWKAGCAPGSVSLRKLSSREYAVESGPCPGGKTVVSHVYYPGWKAYRGGRELKISREKGVFQAVDGGGDFRLVYKPASFAAGLWFTVASLLIWLGLISVSLIK